jgi:NAD-dependent deacetylase
MRPHVLWFDETYDERCYRFESAIRAAEQTDLLLVVGTSGATSLPMQAGMIVARRGAAIVDVNSEENPFGELAERLAVGCHVRGPAAVVLPGIVREIAAAFGGGARRS